MPIWLAGAVGLSSLIGAGASIWGSNQQAKASEKATAAQLQMFGISENELQPYITSGQNSLSWYDYLTGTGSDPSGSGKSYTPSTAPLTAPFTAATLSSTPGYQFTLNQGMKGTQNSYAAQGLGSSGAALKGAADYSTGLAQSTYNQQLSNYLTQNKQTAELLLSPAQLGESAASSLANAATGTSSGVASTISGTGNALAGGASGVANSVSSGLSSAMQLQLLSKLLGGNANTSVNNALASSTASGSLAG